jgi:hypothetical protein
MDISVRRASVGIILTDTNVGYRKKKLKLWKKIKGQFEAQ